MNLFSKLTAQNHPARRQQGHGGSVKKPAVPVKTEVEKLAEENLQLREALRSIMMGTMLDEHNRNDDGIVDFLGGQRDLSRPVPEVYLKKWANIIATALGKKS